MANHGHLAWRIHVPFPVPLIERSTQISSTALSDWFCNTLWTCLVSH
jgi:hypothetical protein